MRVRRFFLAVALATSLVPGPAVHADLNYRAEITRAEDGDLADRLTGGGHGTSGAARSTRPQGAVLQRLCRHVQVRERHR